MMKKSIIIVSLIVFFSACSIYQTVVNLSLLKFKLENVENIKVGNVKINSQSKLSDFSFTEIMQLTTALTQNKLPITFQVNINAKNPNDGNGYPQTDIRITEFPWDLNLKGKKLISGNISSPIVIPGKGKNKIIPLEISFDLLSIIKNKSVDDIIDLVLAISGKGKNDTDLQIVTKPVLGTPFGKLSYPEPITITSKQFN